MLDILVGLSVLVAYAATTPIVHTMSYTMQDLLRAPMSGIAQKI